MSKNYIELPTMPEWAMNQRVENTVQSYACAVIEPYIETLFKIGEHLGIDYQAARTTPGKLSDIYIAAIKADRQRRSEPVKIPKEVIETLEGIVNADWRTWEELASPDVFVRWAKSRVSHALALIAQYGQPVEPEGWQLVPKKPTHEMRLAGKHTIKGADTTFEGILAEYAYLSMLEAAPKFGEEE